MIQVDLKSRIPLYLQIVQSVKNDVISGSLQANDKLPSVRELSAELIINPNTIHKAFRMLEQEGFIYSLSGKGNYIMELKNAKVKEQQEQALKEIAASVERAYRLGVSRDEICSYLERVQKEESHD